MSAKSKIFGTLPDGHEVMQYTLSDGKIECDIITYGGALRALRVPDRSGAPRDVLLGFDDIGSYILHNKHFGALIGRFANRIGGAAFTLGGRRYALAKNDGENHLHGGPGGFDRLLWSVAENSGDSLLLRLESPDGDEGYPGRLSVSVRYSVSNGELGIEYSAVSDADTVCNLTNHAYFNLDGHASGPVSEQEIQLCSDIYTPTDAHSIPTGELALVEGTPMDLRSLTRIGEHADDDFAQLKYAGGYDHNWCVRGRTGDLRPAALAYSRKSGIAMRVLTTQPGVQFYSGNYLDGCPTGKQGAHYAKRHGFCLETQTFPDSPNKPNFPSCTLKKGERYSHTTVYAFDVND